MSKNQAYHNDIIWIKMIMSKSVFIFSKSVCSCYIIPRIKIFKSLIPLVCTGTNRNADTDSSTCQNSEPAAGSIPVSDTTIVLLPCNLQ